ncbi:hypothetical protein GN958_ATG07584 [Phytophthora infestans]|nr:hypothetical protein GN958_ATG07584 [Phytophthora infestans]
MAEWKAVTLVLLTSAEFSRTSLCDKFAQNALTFSSVMLNLDAARKKDKVAARTSGLEEANTEKEQLLDNIIAEVDGFLLAKTLAKVVTHAKVAANAKAGEVVR